jgi:hypothetical protein
MAFLLSHKSAVIPVSAPQINMLRYWHIVPMGEPMGARLKSIGSFKEQFDIVSVIGIGDVPTQLSGQAQQVPKLLRL